MNATTPEALLTLQQACARLQVSRSTFWKLRNEYALPVMRVAGVVRIRERDLDAWIEKHTTSNGEERGHD